VNDNWSVSGDHNATEANECDGRALDPDKVRAMETKLQVRTTETKTTGTDYGDKNYRYGLRGQKLQVRTTETKTTGMDDGELVPVM
jgi:hypothetical protein